MQVELIQVAHAFIPGTRGAAGGAPSKDSLFGVALVQGNVVSFGGRRGGVLRYFTHKKSELPALLERFEGKLVGRPFGKNVEGAYSRITNTAALEQLFPNAAEVVGKGYYTAMSHRKLNIRRTAKVAAE